MGLVLEDNGVDTHSCRCLSYCSGMVVSSSLKRVKGRHSSTDVWYVGVRDSAGSWLRAVVVVRQLEVVLLCCVVLRSTPRDMHFLLGIRSWWHGSGLTIEDGSLQGVLGTNS